MIVVVAVLLKAVADLVLAYVDQASEIGRATQAPPPAATG